SIHFVQCARACSPTSTADPYTVTIDPKTLRAHPPLPKCPRCGEMLRPNILMFGDGWWDENRTTAQQARLQTWLDSIGEAKVVVVECGAGTAIPSVRSFCERLSRRSASLVRINVREPEVPPGGVGLPTGALAALREIDRALEARA